MSTLKIRHNLSEEELTKAITSLAKNGHLEEKVITALRSQCTCDDRIPKEPRTKAMKGIYHRMCAEYDKAIKDLRDYIPRILAGQVLQKAHDLPRPLTNEEIQKIIQAIKDRFSYIAAQIQTEDYIPPQDLIDRWKEQGLIGHDVTPESFGMTVGPEAQYIRNAFIFGRLHLALEAGKTYEEMMKLALTLPLKKPDLYAIAVAEQQAANYITAMGDELGTVAGQLMATKNRAIIQKMVIDYHGQNLPARVLDLEEKQALGMEIPEKMVDTWRGLSSELYHTMQDKARDWDRVAFFETGDSMKVGMGNELLETYGADQLVYKMPLPTACPQCKFLYEEYDGSPRVFNLGKLLSWGNNIGRKPMPTSGGEVISSAREDGRETLKPVAGLVHPFCQCMGPYPVTGVEPWHQEREQREQANLKKLREE